MKACLRFDLAVKMLPIKENLINSIIILQSKDCIYPCLLSVYLNVHTNYFIYIVLHDLFYLLFNTLFSRAVLDSQQI